MGNGDTLLVGNQIARVGEMLIFSMHNIHTKKGLEKLRVLHMERKMYIYHCRVLLDESNCEICNVILPLFEVASDTVQSTSNSAI
jgi:hypothetical protein